MARMRYEAAVAKYNAGLFEEAAHEFEAAYAISHRDELLYNIYLAWRDAGHLERAVAALRFYLPTLTDPATRTRLQATLEATERRLAHAQTTGVNSTVDTNGSTSQDRRLGTPETDSQGEQSLNDAGSEQTHAHAAHRTDPPQVPVSPTVLESEDSTDQSHTAARPPTPSTQPANGPPLTVAAQGPRSGEPDATPERSAGTGSDRSLVDGVADSGGAPGRGAVVTGAIFLAGAIAAGSVAIHAHRNLHGECPSHVCNENGWRADVRRRRRSALIADALATMGLVTGIIGVIRLARGRNGQGHPHTTDLACTSSGCMLRSSFVY